jgi:hypothetical protein
MQSTSFVILVLYLLLPVKLNYLITLIRGREYCLMPTHQFFSYIMARTHTIFIVFGLPRTLEACCSRRVPKRSVVFMQELLCLGVNQYQYILCLIAGYFFCYQINVVGMLCFNKS